MERDTDVEMERAAALLSTACNTKLGGPCRAEGAHAGFHVPTLAAAEDRQDPIAHELQHFALTLLDRRHDAIVIFVDERGRRLLRQMRGEPGEVAHIGEQDRGANAQYLTPPHVAGENTQMRLVTDIHAHHL